MSGGLYYDQGGECYENAKGTCIPIYKLKDLRLVSVLFFFVVSIAYDKSWWNLGMKADRWQGVLFEHVTLSFYDNNNN